MGKSQMIHVDDVARLLQLVGELAEVKGDLSTRGAHLVNELCRIMDAHVGVLGIMQKAPGSTAPVIIAGVEAGFLDETSQRLLRRYVSETHAKDPLLEVMDPTPKHSYSIYRVASVPDRTWYASEFVNEVKFRMNIDDAIYTCFPLNDRNLSVGFGLNRLRGDKPFGERENTLVELVNRHLGWFYRQLVADLPNQRPPLPPSLRRVLSEVLRGASEKEIAQRLHLSTHTVHDHMKRLYQCYSVSSRAELMAKFIP